jgi:hypothetical protein
MTLTTVKEFAKTQGIKQHAMQQRITNFYGDKWPARTRVGKNLMFDHDEALKCCAENPWYNKVGLNSTGRAIGSRKQKPKEKEPFKYEGLIFDFLTGKFSLKFEQKKRMRSMAESIGYKNQPTITVKVISEYEDE